MNNEEAQKYLNSIAQIDEQILKIGSDIENLKNEIMELRWKPFDDAQDKLSNVITEYQTMQKLLGDAESFYNDDGSFTTNGLTNILLTQESIDATKQKIANYREGLNKLEEQYKNGCYSLDEYNEKSKQLLDGIQQESTALSELKQNMLDMYETQIKKENDLLQENIDKRKDALSAKEKYYDYDKTLKKKSKDINTLKSQIAALEGTSNAAAKARLEKLRAELADAEDDMADTMHQHEVDMKNTGYENFSNEANKALDNTLDAVKKNSSFQEAIISGMLTNVTTNYDNTYKHLHTVMDQYRSNSSYGGKGGYSTGTLTLTQKTTIYIYVGGSGNSVTSASNSIYPGGFNGGGYRYNYKGGGGATDIRIGSASLYARVIVAGGGGSDGSSGYSGGYAGGVSGARGNFGCGSYGYGGSQTTSYSSLSAINSQGTTNSSSNCAAGFGFGGFGCYYASGYGGAGGGGWYGGQGTYPDSSGDDDGGGGGGSGYVYTSSSASNYPQGCLLNSSYYLSDASNLSGNESFKSPSGSTETGHSDNGYCRITCYIKKKTLHCKMNNEIKKAAPVFMKMNNKIYDAGANAVMDFAYTGTAQAISLPRGQYIIECWGAQGGYRSSSDYGGKGGYSVGTLTLTQSTDLYIYVGGAGNSSTTRLSNNSSIYEGGFNGGGHRYDYKGGGGATDVRIGKDSLYARIIVAGGGGSDGATNKKGMYGGGLKGGSTTESCGSGGYGGTQTGNTWLTTTRF